MSNNLTDIWVFNGNRPNSTFPGGVFSDILVAEKWIQQYSLSGVLTLYPIDIGVYDWAISEGFFKPKNENHTTPHFIGTFSSAYQKHYHYENGKRIGE